MFKIERITITKRIDDDGELIPDVDSDYFVNFSPNGIPVFNSESNGTGYKTREDAVAVLERLKPIFDNSKRIHSRVYFKVQEMSENGMSIGNNVRRRREQKGMTCADLAKASNVTTSMISHIETGRKKPSVDTLVAIAGALLCKVDDLVH